MTSLRSSKKQRAEANIQPSSAWPDIVAPRERQSSLACGADTSTGAPPGLGAVERPQLQAAHRRVSNRPEIAISSPVENGASQCRQRKRMEKLPASEPSAVDR